MVTILLYQVVILLGIILFWMGDMILYTGNDVVQLSFIQLQVKQILGILCCVIGVVLWRRRKKELDRGISYYGDFP